MNEHLENQPENPLEPELAEDLQQIEEDLDQAQEELEVAEADYQAEAQDANTEAAAVPPVQNAPATSAADQKQGGFLASIPLVVKILAALAALVLIIFVLVIGVLVVTSLTASPLDKAKDLNEVQKTYVSVKGSDCSEPKVVDSQTALGPIKLMRCNDEGGIIQFPQSYTDAQFAQYLNSIEKGTSEQEELRSHIFIGKKYLVVTGSKSDLKDAKSKFKVENLQEKLEKDK